MIENIDVTLSYLVVGGCLVYLMIVCIDIFHGWQQEQRDHEI